MLNDELMGAAHQHGTRQIRDISKAVPAELLIYGRLPLMLMENCVMKNRTGICACQTGTVRLVDRVGEEFPIVKDPGTCRNVLLNGKKLYLLDKKDALRGMGLWALRLQFTTENPGEIDKVLMDYQGRAGCLPAERNFIDTTSTRSVLPPT